ncbi:hypothetical protein VHEMI05547 [[Torrubiella] hemipterigena]|uniref:EamA domain-containing protein n=1 Tax=[Torrubiella] hemipterigena TaxID=1531966 RepID=A0A0A1TJ31_9HYPO|nr:hypothetical protein VHEMI05547 [[Torrubiella] hemipterigena]
MSHRLGAELGSSAQTKAESDYTSGSATGDFVGKSPVAPNGLTPNSQIRFRSPSPSPLSPQPSKYQHRRSLSYSDPGDSSPPSYNEAPVVESKWRAFVQSNWPAILVAVSQFFSATQNLFARLLELDGGGMHPVQSLLFRHSITALCCSTYMFFNKTEDFPWGKKEIRFLLFLRGVCGFFGVFGLWYAMMYIPLADATVITFLAPGIAGFMCYIIMKEPFTRVEQIGTLVAIVGVVLIAQPPSLFGDQETQHIPEHAGEGKGSGGLPSQDHNTTPAERLMAVGFALLSVFGSAAAFTTLRVIGKRAHPLISVNIFGMYSTLICSSILTFAPILNIEQPALHFKLPESVKQWLLLVALGIIGFVMQYCLTSGLGSDKSNKANAMIYTHMIFAAIYDRYIFNHVMGLLSFLGCVLILGSAICAVVLKKPPGAAQRKVEDTELQDRAGGEGQRAALMDDMDGVEDSRR